LFLKTFIGTVVVVFLPVCTAEIINRWGLRESWYFLAGVNFLTILMSLTYKSRLPNNRKENMTQRLKKSLGVEILRNKKFLIWCVGSIIGQIAYLTPIIIIVRIIYLMNRSLINKKKANSSIFQSSL
jgi:uncharacterized membrane protein